MNREQYKCPCCRKVVARGRWHTFTYCVTCIGFTRRDAIRLSIRWARARGLRGAP